MTPATLSSNKNPSQSSLAYDTSPGGSRRNMMLSNKRDVDQLRSETALFNQFTQNYDLNKYIDYQAPVVSIPKTLTFYNLIKAFGISITDMSEKDLFNASDFKSDDSHKQTEEVVNF